ncbi:MAG: hypothetical protein BWY89_00442 [Bacteroidetes bacterium ADurb.BinA012]|nr:MAG: hypothetical protein BWY89_00442 [Bacteroidetes bacterium ADurb.BinA012]
MCGTPLAARYSCVLRLKARRPSLSPHDIHNTFNSFFAFSGSGTSCSGGFVFGADEKPPTHANLSGFPRPKFSACPPPMDKPAMARCSRSLITGYFFSMNGMRSLSRSFSNVAKASTLSGAIMLPPARSSFMALPFGMTTIIGSIFPSA